MAVAMPLVSRPDLSNRTAISKSAISGFDFCATRSWYERWYPRPRIATEKMVFGSAVDAAVEQVLIAVRAGIPIEEARALAAAEEVAARDGVDISIEEVERAVTRFTVEIVPLYDWSFCGLQVHLHEELEGIGEADGHPDIRLNTGSIYDVKTAAKRKYDTDAQTSVELGFYALLSEAETGKPTPFVGYFTWVRTSKPHWQIVQAPVTDEMRRRAYEVAMAFVRAKAADELLNRSAKSPVNFSFGSGPKFPSLCADCAFAPHNDGPCRIAVRGETPE